VIKYSVEPLGDIDLRGYGDISIAFEVKSRVDLDALEAGEPNLIAIAVDPWVKDYDAYEQPDSWPSRFETKNWYVISAWDLGTRVGGLVVAFNSPGVDMLEGRKDLAVVWDLRVRPTYRGQGIGHALFLAAIKLARALGCSELKVETQDINVGACHLYSSLGCVASSIEPGAYAELPDEAMILWRLPLKVPALQQ